MLCATKPVAVTVSVAPWNVNVSAYAVLVRYQYFYCIFGNTKQTPIRQVLLSWRCKTS